MADFTIYENNQNLCFSRNRDDLVLLRTNESATYILMSVSLNGTMIGEGIRLYYDNDDFVRIKVKEIVRGLIRYELPTENFHRESFDRLVFVLKDEADNTVEISMPTIEGEVHPDIQESWFDRNFLTSQAQIIPTRKWQPQWLSFAKADQGELLTVTRIKAKLYTAEGREITSTICNIERSCLMRINTSFQSLWSDIKNVTPIAYDVYGIGLTSPTQDDTEGLKNHPFAQRYILQDESIYDRCFVFQNSVGGFDSIIASGISTYQPTGDATAFVNNGVEGELGGAYTSFWEQNTGFITNDRIARQWHEFLNSTNRYLYNLEYNEFRAIIVDEYEVKDKLAALGSYKFKYHMAEKTEGALYIRKELPDHPLPVKYFDHER